MWLMKTLLTSVCINQREAGQFNWLFGRKNPYFLTFSCDPFRRHSKLSRVSLMIQIVVKLPWVILPEGSQARIK